MKCQRCDKEFGEKDIQLSHDIPCYLFEGNRRGKSNQADKFGRHNLCKKCHLKYEIELRTHLQYEATIFARSYFKK